MKKSLFFTLAIFISILSLEAQPVWTPIGPEGGFLLTIAIAPSAPNVLYGGCDAYGGIYKSADGGEHWQFLSMLTEIGHVMDVEIHPNSPDIVYAACGEGLFKTTDGGVTWDEILARDGIIYSCGVDPNSPNTIFAGVVIDTNINYALYKSINAGISWSDSSFQGIPVLDICFYPESLNTILLGTSYGVWQSTDAGGNWSWCGPPNPSASVFSLAVVDLDTFYAGTHPDYRDAGAVYKTTNGGATWDTSYALGKKVLGLAVDRDSTHIVYMAAGDNMFGTEGMFKTTNSGANWLSINNGLTDRMATKVQIDPVSPNVIYATTDGLGGVYKSTNRGASWTQIVSGMRHSITEALCFDAANTLYAASGWGTYRDIPCVFKTTNSGDSWQSCAMIPSPYYMTSIWDMITHPDSEGVVYVAGMSHYSTTSPDSTQGLIYRSTNGGGTWQELWTPDTLSVFCLAVDATTGYLYAGTGGNDFMRIYKVHRSTDGGSTWPATAGWNVAIGNPILDIVIDPTSPNILYAGTSGGVFKSTDYGANWIPQYAMASVNTITTDPAVPNILYAASGGPYIDSGGVYKSTDAGVSWNKLGLGAYSVYSLVSKFGATDTFYAGTGGKFLQTAGNGVFRSVDNGATWDSVNTGLTSRFVLTMATDPSLPNIIYAGTMGGIFALNELAAEEKPNNTFSTPLILQVLPNPFNQTTMITYALSSKHYAENNAVPTAYSLVPTIRIYDATGRLVKSFPLSTHCSLLATGIIWDGTDDSGTRLPGGVYFIKLEVNNNSVIRKTLYLR